MAIRTCITIIDALCFRIKQATLATCKIRGKYLSVKDIEILSEVRIKKAKKGKVKKIPKYTESKENIKFTFKKFAYAFDTHFEIKEDESWNFYRQTLEIRHRITHPKKIENLHVSARDYNTASKAFEWFGKCFGRLLSEIKKQNPLLTSTEKSRRRTENS